jgi:serine protease Do
MITVLAIALGVLAGWIRSLQLQLTAVASSLATHQTRTPEIDARDALHDRQLALLESGLREMTRTALTLESFTERHGSIVPDVVARCEPAVIHIVCKGQHTDANGRVTPRNGVGSGFLIEDGRYAITNYHVVAHASGDVVSCTFLDRRVVQARVHASDPASDIALLQLDPLSTRGMQTVRFCERNVRPGETVLVLGSPQGMARSVTLGILSNINRYHGTQPMPFDWIATGRFNNWLQTDTAINPGNSGGPMFNLQGEVVGVVTRKLARADVDNIGFAIPIAHVRGVVDQLKRGQVERSSLGLFLTSYPSADGQTNRGILVIDTIPSGPADVAGIQRGDVITHLNDAPISAGEPEELPVVEQALAVLPIGQPLRLRLQRGGREQRVDVRPWKRHLDEDRVLHFAQFGCFARELDVALARQVGNPSPGGLWICGVQTGGMLERAGVRRGDTLLTLAHPTLGTRQLTGIAEAWSQLHGALQNRLSPLTFTLYRQGQHIVVNIAIQYGG